MSDAQEICWALVTILVCAGIGMMSYAGVLSLGGSPILGGGAGTLEAAGVVALSALKFFAYDRNA